jgi:Fic family protein
MAQGQPEESRRAGVLSKQKSGYRAFIPANLPPRDLGLSGLLRRLSVADRALARLDGAVMTLPNPNLFIYMYVRREAVLSSQIEGTRASMIDVLAYEAERDKAQQEVPVADVMNYIGALRYGLDRLKTLPVSLRLVREIHSHLMKGVRGGEPHKTPGEFRTTQNWWGGSSPMNARFVPPPPEEMTKALNSWEEYVHRHDELPDLIHIGLVHAQFETIHPFVDGNGRIGRLLISLLLAERKILEQPLLYLSIFFKKHKEVYYDRLQAIRDKGEWEEWLEFFVDGVADVATEATETAKKILALREGDRGRISAMGRRSGNAHRLLDWLFRQPMVTVKTVEHVLKISQPAANALIDNMHRAKILKEITGYKRNRRFSYDGYLRLFEEADRRGP